MVTRDTEQAKINALRRKLIEARNYAEQVADEIEDHFSMTRDEHADAIEELEKKSARKLQIADNWYLVALVALVVCLTALIFRAVFN